MDKPIFKSDMFAGKISENTKKALGAYEELRLGAEAEFDALALSHGIVTDEIAKSLVEKYRAMGDQVLVQMQQNHAKQYDEQKRLFAESDILSEEEEQKRLAKLLEDQAQELETYKQQEQRKLEIVTTANEQNRALTEAEIAEIANLNSQGQQKAIEELTLNQQEQLTILDNMKNQKEMITAEEAGNTVAHAVKTRDSVVKEANKKYEETVASAVKGRDELGTISKEEADDIIAKAEETKNETVSQAEDKHYEIVKHAQQQAGKHVGEVDWETGTVMNRWSKMNNYIAKIWNPIAEKFGLDKMKIHGEYKVNARQRLKDQNAQIVARAKGTPNGLHKGGLALVGEEGMELAHIPNRGYTMLGAGGQEIVDLPRGSSVLPFKHTQDILKQYGFPAYKDGVGDFDIFDIFTKGAKSFWDNALEKSRIFKEVVMPSWFPSTRDILGKISGGVVKKLKDEMDEFLSFDNYKGGGAEMARKAIIQALQITGKPMSWLQPMMTIANKESSFNPSRSTLRILTQDEVILLLVFFKLFNQHLTDIR